MCHEIFYIKLKFDFIKLNFGLFFLNKRIKIKINKKIKIKL
jgi:hypothetical protein